jgi:hypothetical protein
MLKLKKRQRKSEKLNEEVHTIIAKIGDLYQEAVDHATEREKKKILISSGKEVALSLKRFYDNMNLRDGIEFSILLQSIQIIIEMLLSHIEEKIGQEMINSIADHVHVADKLVTDEQNRVIEPITRIYGDSPLVGIDWKRYEDQKVRDWKQWSLTRQCLTLEEAWKGDMKFDTEEDYLEFVKVRKEGIMTRYFPHVKEEKLGDIWKAINLSKRIDLPFTVGDIPNLSQDDIKSLLQVYFRDTAKGITGLENLQGRLTGKMNALTSSIEL